MTMHNAQAIAATAAPQAIVERDALTRAMEIATLAIEKRGGVPVLQTARLTGDGDRLFVTGTDLDCEITVTVPGAADSRFAACLPAHRVKDLLKKARKSDYAALTANAETDDTKPGATVEFDSVRYDLDGETVEDFPVLNLPEAAHAFTMAGETFNTMLRRTMGAISTEETRYYLNGVFAHEIDGQLRFVATDGHRMYMQDVTAPDGCEGMPGVIVPRKTVATLHRLTKGRAMPESVKIDVTVSRFVVTFDTPEGLTVVINSKTIDGTFVDYQRVVPIQFERTLKAKADDVIGGIADVSVIASDRGRAVKIELGATVALEVNNPDAGRARGEIAATYEGNPMEIGFNWQYLAEITKAAECDDVTVRFNDAGSPAVITGEHEGWKAVLMPMRV
ncbi:DNA polymerase III subunit beta [Oceaniradius stylonematis]|uniref:DNA polymerase III subunit beta n=1 Tax=Oceaniradius stylonematis TaxID=2184161 RepID=UPI00273D57A5|nr:DNA polymerase III subunit beta [Oceaniradius stylonematis]